MIAATLTLVGVAVTCEAKRFLDGDDTSALAERGAKLNGIASLLLMVSAVLMAVTDHLGLAACWFTLALAEFNMGAGLRAKSRRLRANDGEVERLEAARTRSLAEEYGLAMPELDVTSRTDHP